ncbi:MAG: hypothetical protein ACRDQZ_25150 [Mycobacteriales bacterium]
MPDELKERPVLNVCTLCGCRGNGSCGRLIGRDGSVWPDRDTGFLIGDPKAKWMAKDILRRPNHDRD